MCLSIDDKLLFICINDRIDIFNTEILTELKSLTNDNKDDVYYSRLCY